MRRIEAAVRVEQGTLTASFVLEGDLSRIRVPPSGAPRVGDRLWHHTCFELFVGATHSAAYHELNFSPSREWAAYAFRGYRDGGPVADAALAPGIAVRAGADLRLDASVALERLSTGYGNAALRIGVSAVVEETNGTISYWALRHPPGNPDFHHADAFALVLEPAR